MDISKEDILVFQEKILLWYAVHQRDLPWRKTRDPYRILISEVMLQQTQVSRVIPKYEQWLHLFPTIKSLADGSVSDVLRAWSGLGYNRRALFLKRLAEVIVQNYGGEFPQEEKLLLQLPGVGKYTARAILCFAFDKQVAVVDTNVKKVILTQLSKRGESVVREQGAVYGKDQHRTVENDIWRTAELLLPNGKAYDWNQALMDFSSAMLKKEKIKIPKQSMFVGSRRYYRGELLKNLIEKEQLSVEELMVKFKKSKSWIEMLLNDLEKEGFLVVENGDVRLL